MNSLTSLLHNWIIAEPIASLWLGIVAILLFGVTFTNLTKGTNISWERGFLMALAQTLTIVSLIWTCYFILTSGFKAFSQIYGSFTTGGSLSNRAWQQWRNLYGGGYDQKDLEVVQYVTVVAEEVIPPSDPSGAPLYRTVKVEQPIQQNSIIGFRGNVELTAAGGYNNANTFNVYTLAAEYEYDIVNSSTEETRAEFRFPISSTSKLYQDIVIKVNEKEIPWRIADQAIFWEDRLTPGEKQKINIRFHTWGENDFLFEVPEQREITNFSLKLAMNTDNC